MSKRAGEGRPPGCMLVQKQVTRGPRGAHQPGLTSWAGTSPYLGGHSRNPDQFNIPRQRPIAVAIPGAYHTPARWEQLRNGEFRLVVDYRGRRTPAEPVGRLVVDYRGRRTPAEPVGPSADHWVGASHSLLSYIDDSVSFVTGNQSIVGGTPTPEPVSPAVSAVCSEVD